MIRMNILILATKNGITQFDFALIGPSYVSIRFLFIMNQASLDNADELHSNKTNPRLELLPDVQSIN